MATLYRPKVIRYRMPDGSYRAPDGKLVNKRTPGAVRIEAESPTWWGRYTDGNGDEHQVKLSGNKDVARRMLAKLAGDAQLVSVGIVDPFAEHRARPLIEHLEDFGRYLAAKGDTSSYVQTTVNRASAVLEGTQTESLGDLQPSAVMEFLAELRTQGPVRAELPRGKEWFTKAELVAALGIHPGSVARMMQRDGLEGQGKGKARRYHRDVIEAFQDRLCRGFGISTSNHYLTAVKGFTHWLVKDRRAPHDPLACLSRMNPDTDLRVRRRALPPEEFAAFLAAAQAGRPFRGLAGPIRAVIYHLAARTGLRASELASLAPASFDFTAEPTVTVEAAYSKRRRKDVLDLRADVAALMRDFIKGRPPRAPLWPGCWHEDGAQLVRLDLAAAGIAYIDPDGMVYDFHALRHQFITDMVEAGIHPKDAQALARHSTITLTMDRYAHVRRPNLRAALESLPNLAPDTSPAEEGPRKQA